MKLTEKQWEDVVSKLTPGMSKDDIRKVLEYSHSVMDENDECFPDDGDMNSNGAYYLFGDWVSPREFYNHMKSLSE